MTNDHKVFDRTQVELNQFEHPAWDEPIICRVEVDLPGWLAQLTGDRTWEIYGEDEEETCISFTMRQRQSAEPRKLLVPKQAEVTLYHNGYAVVDVDGEALFDGSLTTGTSECAHLSYYHATGEQIILN
ncbi:MAG: hypothetical protein B7X95_07900 [Methylophilaceae bacterium 17-44-8]|nr:MAG: hypothetical protein B7Y48_10675 [Methylophilales bacterium 28-44-11]OYZ01501.1 MAG: hypothetical protein B7Y32_05480 [Methylophilales bacterium 16-45-7]OZA05076.1 MAG: hypothetical protein B7X95_07900 [Methylophilaceae bacterium 17-44-8]